MPWSDDRPLAADERTPWSDDRPLAADERTPFARLIGRRLRNFSPSDEQALRVLVVFESAVTEEPNAAGLDNTVLRHVIDSLSGLSETTGLQVTLLTGNTRTTGVKASGTSAGDTVALPSERSKLIDAPLRTYAKRLAEFDILQFVPASQSSSYDTESPDIFVPALNRRQPTCSLCQPLRSPVTAPELGSRQRCRLPPLMVLPSDFVRQARPDGCALCRPGRRGRAGDARLRSATDVDGPAGLLRAAA